MENPKLNPFILTFTLLALALPGLPENALAKGGKERGGEAAMMKKLDLSEEQQKKLKEIRKADREKIKAARSEMKAAHQKLKESMQKDTSDSELTKLHSEVQKRRSRLAELHFQKVLKVRAVLTPEQRKKFHEFHGRHRGKRGKHGHHGKGHMHGGEMEDHDSEE